MCLLRHPPLEHTPCTPGLPLYLRGEQTALKGFQGPRTVLACTVLDPPAKSPLPVRLSVALCGVSHREEWACQDKSTSQEVKTKRKSDISQF